MLEARAAAAHACHPITSIAQQHEFAMKERGATGDSSFIAVRWRDVTASTTRHLVRTEAVHFGLHGAPIGKRHSPRGSCGHVSAEMAQGIGPQERGTHWRLPRL
jgi:hypothetical protein